MSTLDLCRLKLMKNNCKDYVFISIIASAIIASFISASFAFEEQELKKPIITPPKEKTILKGNISETVTQVKPLTGIGVIGLRFIHQNGYPTFVEEVYSNSPANRAGLKPRDLIFAIDGIRTDQLTPGFVYDLLSGEPGSKVKVFITRDRSMFSVELVREDLANFSDDVQNRYLSGPITVPFDVKKFIEYH